MEQFIYDLKLAELNYYQISNSDVKKSAELYKKGQKLIKLGYQLYWNDNSFEEAIEVFD